MALRVVVAPRFDYGQLDPWIRRHGPGRFSAVGGDQALLVASDLPLARLQDALAGVVSLRAGQRRRLAPSFAWPHQLDTQPPPASGGDWAAKCDRRLGSTVARWRRWSSQGRAELLAGPGGRQLLRSAIVLKALATPAPARSRPPRPAPCPSRSAAAATGTTGFAGSATPR